MVNVSIILPSLNVKEYIGEALESVVRQSEQNIEVLCVDAGSVDGTLDIINEYINKDARVRLIHSEKKSYGYQMNLGISLAKGDYIGILETDDYVEKDMYEKLYEVAIQNDADVVKSNYAMFITDENGEKVFLEYPLSKWNRVEYNKVFSAEKYISSEYKVESYIWNAIYRKEFLIQNAIMFSETAGAAFQDFGFKYQVAYLAKRIVVDNGSYYRYRRDNSQSSTYNPRTVEYNLWESQNLLRIWKMRNASNKLLSAVACEIVEYAFEPYMELLRNTVPSVETDMAWDAYRKLFTEFLANEWVRANNIENKYWVLMNLLVEDKKAFLKYTEVVSRLDAKYMQEYLENINKHEKILIFGAGMRGRALFSLLKRNGINGIVGFCDNNKRLCSDKKSSRIYSVEETIKYYPDAYYIVANNVEKKNMILQLLDLHVKEENIGVYELSIHPFFCTNRVIELE